MNKIRLGPEAIVQSQVDAYNARDIERFLGHYRRDAVILKLSDGSIVAKGHTQLRKIYGALFDANPSLKCTIVRRITRGQFVIDEESITGRATKADLTAVVIYRVIDGLISRAWLL